MPRRDSARTSCWPRLSDSKMRRLIPNQRVAPVIRRPRRRQNSLRVFWKSLSDRGVILLRKIVLQAIKTATQGGRPKGVLSKTEMPGIRLRTFVGAARFIDLQYL